jgi:hypothetical protein
LLKTCWKKAEVGLTISQMDINIPQARGVGFDSSSHAWGFLGLLIVGLIENKWKHTAQEHFKVEYSSAFY